ncbi:MAG: hypothetical protein COX79_00520 [Candidatus Levybacteria bacterium CG_4_10_14_0_2_um_filter_36_16]|nr:MAG: hypothetical protein AUK12_03515 [Candidatus Levybacteria bacterium CG2_30_37_29]PIZ97893.1 MAG: hypothetical protein COX79_00520 [Candidatus Levybacteria bacterium CG_4_10_14_0_2_um_filter_36_16]
MQKKNTTLPQFLRPYFWDVKFEDINIAKNPQFVLKRIIDRGDTKSLFWALTKFSLEDIRNIITTSRDLSPRTANFWAFVMGINPKQVPCLQKPYSRIPFGPFN